MTRRVPLPDRSAALVAGPSPLWITISSQVDDAYAAISKERNVRASTRTRVIKPYEETRDNNLSRITASKMHTTGVRQQVRVDVFYAIVGGPHDAVIYAFCVQSLDLVFPRALVETLQSAGSHVRGILTGSCWTFCGGRKGLQWCPTCVLIDVFLLSAGNKKMSLYLCSAAWVTGPSAKQPLKEPYTSDMTQQGQHRPHLKKDTKDALGAEHTFSSDRAKKVELIIRLRRML